MANKDETGAPSLGDQSPVSAQRIDIVGAEQPSSTQTAPKLSPELQKRIKNFETSTAKQASVVPDVPTTPLAEASEPDAQLGVAKLDDAVSDAAVDEISAHDSDELLSAEDAASGKAMKKKSSNNRFVRILKHKLTWLIIVIVALIVVFVVPLSRYKVLGLIIKKSYVVTVTDSKTYTPVSYATVRLDGKLEKTNATGKVVVKVPVGYGELSISKQYYQSYEQRIAVGLRMQSQPTHVTLVATGRQVPVTVENEITGQPVADATIAILNTTARTNSKGKATIVVPTKAGSYSVTISASGYNNTASQVTVTSSVIASNNFKLTPSGRLYFLSNATGKINVDSANLDGSGVQITLAGTGNETTATTALYNSTDWRYLMLMAQRTSTAGDSGLYLINTANDNALTTVSEGDYSYTPIGWSGHYFVYEVQDLSLGSSQAGEYTLKSYDADTAHSITLDQTNATGTATDNASQYFTNFYIINGKLIYTKLWSGDSNYYASNNFTSSINTIDVNGLSQAPLQQFPMTADATTTINALSSTMYAANELYFEASFNDGSTQFYSYNDGNVTTASITAATFNAVYYTPGVLSPSGALAAFTSSRNGQFVLLTGTPNATTSSQHTVATLSRSYSFYGWYTDSYILLSYKNSQLYIMPASGLSANQQPLKIANYLYQTNSGDQ